MKASITHSGINFLLQLLTVFNICPLKGFHLILRQVFEFVFFVRSPSNSLLVKWYFLTQIGLSALIESESIIEKTLGHKTAWEGCGTWVEKWLFCSSCLIWLANSSVATNFLICDNWGAVVSDIIYGQVVAQKLFVWSWLHVTTMVLVEVVKLVVDIDWWLDGVLDCDCDLAWVSSIGVRVILGQRFYSTIAYCIILLSYTLNVVAHDIESDT